MARSRRLAYSPAVPRLREIPKAEASAPIVLAMYERLFGDRDPVAEPGTATGTPGNWWTVFANSPDVLEHAGRGFGLYASPDRKVPGELRELGQTRAGWARGSQFVYSQHCKASRGVGLTEEQIQSIPHWQTATCYSELERAVLAYTDDLVLGGGRVPDGTFAILKKHLSDVEILELTYTTALYDFHATISKALRLEFDDVDERIVEVAAPKGSGADVMRMVDRKE